MTTINDNIELVEGTNQSYGKLYANDSKELHYIDSSGTDTNLTQSGDFVSNTTFTENKDAQNQINHAVIQALDGYVASNNGYVKKVYVLTSASARTSTGTFATYTIPANTLQVGSVITILAGGQTTAFSSGSSRMSVAVNNFLIADDNGTGSPTNGWYFYGHGSVTIYSIGSSGTVARGGIGISGVQGTRDVADNVPVLINGINTIDTTQDIDISMTCEISGSMTLEARQFIITIS